jgi:hypothetical protein
MSFKQFNPKCVRRAVSGSWIVARTHTCRLNFALGRFEVLLMKQIELVKASLRAVPSVSGFDFSDVQFGNYQMNAPSLDTSYSSCEGERNNLTSLRGSFSVREIGASTRGRNNGCAVP